MNPAERLNAETSDQELENVLSQMVKTARLAGLVGVIFSGLLIVLSSKIGFVFFLAAVIAAASFTALAFSSRTARHLNRYGRSDHGGTFGHSDIQQSKNRENL